MIRIEQLLKDTIGLHAASVGSGLISRAARLRMKRRGIQKPKDYERLVSESPTELTELIESVVVTETWFFRDAASFNALGTLVREGVIKTRAPGILRVLSLPCSTGEEPYSIAMTLLDAGLSADAFAIDAVDISHRVLEQAKRAVYRKNSFRGKPLGFRDRYFHSTKEGYVLHPGARQSVRFEQGNLLDPAFGFKTGIYDVVFARNLLIYFDAETQQRAVSRIAGLLAPGGICFVGAAELPLLLAGGFTRAELPHAFACWLGQEAKPSAASSAAQAQPLLAPASVVRTTNSRHANPAVTHATAGTSGMIVHTTLQAARKLADAGNLSEAEKLCAAHVRQHGPCAHSYYLLGLVCEAQGRAEAVDFYRRALYLKPTHYESLLQLALIAERNGQAESARNLRRRAGRVHQRDDTAQAVAARIQTEQQET